MLVALAVAVAGLGLHGPQNPRAVAATNAEVEVFLAELADGAKQSWYQFGVPASVTLAQAALETGWGSSSLSSKYNNYFGIKCNKTKPSPYQNGCVDMVTTEYDSKGNPYQIVDSFRTYSSVANSMLDHGYYLKTRGLYTRAFPKNEDPCQFAIEVRRGGYATDPGYATLLITLMRQRNMFRFDWRSGVGPAPCDQTTNLNAAALGGTVDADPLLPDTKTPVLAARVGLTAAESAPASPAAPASSAANSTVAATTSAPPTTAPTDPVTSTATNTTAAATTTAAPTSLPTVSSTPLPTDPAQDAAPPAAMRRPSALPNTGGG